MVLHPFRNHRPIAAPARGEEGNLPFQSSLFFLFFFEPQTDPVTQLTPLLALLLVHDFLLAKGGIALPASHGLRVSIEKHKSRLTAEFTRARIRRKCSTVQALTERVEASVYADSQYPRWIRINTLQSSLDEQLATTFDGYAKVDSVQKVLLGGGDKLVYIDEHIPNLVAVSPRFDFAKSAAYKSGSIILQDKASCFPAYLLDPRPQEGDVIDGCAAPGNKTTHVAAIIKSQEQQQAKTTIHAFEKDARRAKTLEKMVKIAGSDRWTHVHQGQDFLKVDPSDQWFSNVSAILLDPSCSGSGIVGRDDMPELHLPKPIGAKAQTKISKKRKLPEADNVMVDDDGNTTVVTSDKDLKDRLDALSSFQLTLLLHAFTFPAAKKLTYSTCSVHAEENEHVVLKALQSDIAQQCGWRILPRQSQVSGLQSWPVRGRSDACDGNDAVAEACIRAYKDDGRCVMGFFVAAFVRDENHVSIVPLLPTSGKVKPCKPTSGSSSNASTAKNGNDRGSESDWSGFDD